MIGTTIPVFGELNKKGFSKQKLKQFVCQFTLYTNKTNMPICIVVGITEGSIPQKNGKSINR
jgi:hypothetical protein